MLSQLSLSNDVAVVEHVFFCNFLQKFPPRFISYFRFFTRITFISITTIIKPNQNKLNSTKEPNTG